VFHGPQRAAKAMKTLRSTSWGQGFGSVQMDLRSTSNHEKPSDLPAVSSWGRPSGLRPGFRPARSFPVTSGRFFNGAAELPLGAELYVSR
jgi:hypothetical protein